MYFTHLMLFLNSICAFPTSLPTQFESPSPTFHKHYTLSIIPSHVIDRIYHYRKSFNWKFQIKVHWPHDQYTRNLATINAVGTRILSLLKWQKCKADHSPPSSTEVKNACGYTSTLPYVFMVWYLIKHRYNFNF
jgi:hypothetical protein